MFYAKSTGGFYDPAIHGDNMPDDAVAITTERYAELLQGHVGGKRVVGDENGHPVLVDPPPASKAEMWQRIKAKREQVKNGGVKVGDNWFHSDDASRIQQIGLVMMGAGIPPGLQWKTMDGTFVAMTPALAGQVFQAVGASDQTIFAVAETHKAAMEAAADPAAYDFSAGWPETFGG